ncbi:MAG: CCA tRNA nucleotidyltransferase [Alphaproteobacteria bacterium]|nr:CCA tRNA nucleotidyltransferase [Alphaproteobacteria bacterium]
MPKTERLDPHKQPWMTAHGARAILDAIASAGGDARFVGGAVRDALLGRETGDVDLAVNLPPDRVMKALKKAGIMVVPTGLDHGTVTAVADHKGYEVTTLRYDVETFGRRARVAFTDNWKADASRRDFTMNALYADGLGKIYDYFDGLKDLKAGRVRFIGKADDRIHEDVLRILRFFRFYAWYGRGAADKEALRACKKLAPLLPQLSAERVWKELAKLLLAADPVPALRLMMKSGVLTHVLPEAKNVERIARLVELERIYAAKAGSVRRLAALIGPDDAAAKSVARRLKFSLHDAGNLAALARVVRELPGHTRPGDLRRLMYEESAQAVRDGLLLLAASGDGRDLKSAIKTVKAWEAPLFPVQGRDIVKLGVPAGPRVGKILRAVETWWQENDFRPARDACLAEAKRCAKSGKS